jgi:hypothetical protein
VLIDGGEDTLFKFLSNAGILDGGGGMKLAIFCLYSVYLPSPLFLSLGG